MIDHEQYRRALLANPKSREPELVAHYDSCAECRAYAERVLKFEERLKRALEVPLGGGADILPFERREQRRSRASRVFALAASVILGLVIAGGLWLSVPKSTLAADVVAHMAGEPDAWNTREAVPDTDAEKVFSNANMHLAPSAGVVSYASGCEFRHHVVPHLVVQSPKGPVTVMVLVHEHVKSQQQFDEQGYRGTIVPIKDHGSIAVLMKDPNSSTQDVDAVAAQVKSAIVWN
jgi:hypothetical protein